MTFAFDADASLAARIAAEADAAAVTQAEIDAAIARATKICSYSRWNSHLVPDGLNTKTRHKQICVPIKIHGGDLIGSVDEAVNWKLWFVVGDAQRAFPIDPAATPAPTPYAEDWKLVAVDMKSGEIRAIRELADFVVPTDIIKRA